MTYQRQSEVPRKGQTEQELRIASLLVKMRLKHYINQVFCFACRNHTVNDGYHYPSACRVCFQLYDEPALYCMPDFILENEGKKGVIYVNGGIHDKNKQTKKDRRQIGELKAAGYKVFVIKNEEIDSMTNATLIGYLRTVFDAVANDGLYKIMYDNEKEYACLR